VRKIVLAPVLRRVQCCDQRQSSGSLGVYRTIFQIARNLFVATLLVAGAVAAEKLLVDSAANKLIGKYEAATCDQLKAQRIEPPSEKEKIALDLLRDACKARVAFVDKIAAPVLNKMFDRCMIP
jgi:hypothetical protein